MIHDFNVSSYDATWVPGTNCYYYLLISASILVTTYEKSGFQWPNWICWFITAYTNGSVKLLTCRLQSCMWFLIGTNGKGMRDGQISELQLYLACVPNSMCEKHSLLLFIIKLIQLNMLHNIDSTQCIGVPTVFVCVYQVIILKRYILLGYVMTHKWWIWSFICLILGILTSLEDFLEIFKI